MARYWWQCTSCGDRPAWLKVCRSRSIAAFIWDELAPGGWDQRLLNPTCACGRGSLRITYRLRRGDPELVSVRHLVGVGPKGDMLAMLWETFRHSRPRSLWIDFKYQRGRSPWGLTKRLVLERVQFGRLLRKYSRATGREILPPASASASASSSSSSRAIASAARRPRRPGKRPLFPAAPVVSNGS